MSSFIRELNDNMILNKTKIQETLSSLLEQKSLDQIRAIVRAVKKDVETLSHD
jgi:hypothetical protein